MLNDETGANLVGLQIFRVGCGSSCLSSMSAGTPPSQSILLSAKVSPLCDLSRDTQRKLRHLPGPAAALHNPDDVAGASDADPRKLTATSRSGRRR